MLGKRQYVDDIRTIWPLEPDFSNWLASPDGLALIAEDLGIEIQDARRECRPGDFPCDIVGKYAGDEDHTVIIENQFKRTDHDHLGKLVTYAAMNSAVTAIWVAESASDDHRKAIDWLNENTPVHLSFYLVELKAYRIDGSPAAPFLDVVCRPNMGIKVIRERSQGKNIEMSAWQLRYWEQILNFIRDQRPHFAVGNPTAGYYHGIRLTKSFRVEMKLVPGRGSVVCQLIIDGVGKDNLFSQLEANKSTIEQEFGEKLQWVRSEEKDRARVINEIQIDPRDDTNRLKVQEWMYNQVLKFHNVFSPRIAQLKPVVVNDLEPEPFTDS